MPHRTTHRLLDRRGIALPTALLVSLMVIGLCTVAVTMSTSGQIVRTVTDRASVTKAASLAGLEEARSRITHQASTLIPDSGFTTLEEGEAVTDASGKVIPGVARWTWVGRVGIATGQEGRAVAIVSRSTMGNVQSIERMDVSDESFARFDYFSNTESPSTVWSTAGGTENMLGPVHSNGTITVHATGQVVFKNEFSTAAPSVSGAATFYRGATYNHPIAMPTIASLAALRTYAEQGSTAFTLDGPVPAGYAGPSWAGLVRARIEFVAIDLNADGDSTDSNEGFFRVYYGNDPLYVSARLPQAGIQVSRNCGDRDAAAHGGNFVPMSDHTTSDPTHNVYAALGHPTARCYLGGDPALRNGIFEPSTADGAWQPYPGGATPALVALGRSDAGYLFPLSRAFNPDFRGVIYVDGKVGVSGVARGRVTVVSPLGIVILDDLTQANDPGSELCTDVIGLASPAAIQLANNMINSPGWNGSGSPTDSSKQRPFDDTRDEFLHAVILTLDSFLNEDKSLNGYGSVPNGESCDSKIMSRGCFRHTGGTLQNSRSPYASTQSGGTLAIGHRRLQSYNFCAPKNPPPYFPTTGRFPRGPTFPVDPVGFEVEKWFAERQAL